MKVIFLDFNGILDTHDCRDVINKDNLARLKYIIEITQSKVVISSSLKNSYFITGHLCKHLRNIIKELKEAGIEVIDITPKCENRMEEIKLYLKLHPEIDNYCILDDDYEMKELSTHLVKLPPQMQKNQNGLEEKYVNQAIKILQKNTL